MCNPALLHWHFVSASPPAVQAAVAHLQSFQWDSVRRPRHPRLRRPAALRGGFRTQGGRLPGLQLQFQRCQQVCSYHQTNTLIKVSTWVDKQFIFYTSILSLCGCKIWTLYDSVSFWWTCQQMVGSSSRLHRFHLDSSCSHFYCDITEHLVSWHRGAVFVVRHGGKKSDEWSKPFPKSFIAAITHLIFCHFIFERATISLARTSSIL